MINLDDAVKVKGSDDIIGKVTNRRFTDDGKAVQYLMAWQTTDAGTGAINDHERWFTEDEVNVVEKPS